MVPSCNYNFQGFYVCIFAASKLPLDGGVCLYVAGKMILNPAVICHDLQVDVTYWLCSFWLCGHDGKKVSVNGWSPRLRTDVQVAESLFNLTSSIPFMVSSLVASLHSTFGRYSFVSGRHATTPSGFYLFASRLNAVSTYFWVEQNEHRNYQSFD